MVFNVFLSRWLHCICEYRIGGREADRKFGTDDGVRWIKRLFKTAKERYRLDLEQKSGMARRCVCRWLWDEEIPRRKRGYKNYIENAKR